MNRRAIGVLQKFEIMWKITWLWIIHAEKLRLGQMIYNSYTKDPRTYNQDLFYLEDYDLLDSIIYTYDNNK